MNKQFHRSAVNRKTEKRNTSASLTDLDWILAFDTETTIQFDQTMRFGVFCFGRISDDQIERTGFIVGRLEDDEEMILRDYAKKINAPVYTRDDFINRVFYPAIMRGCAIAGHNIAFDLGRLMTSNDSASQDEWRLKICNCSEDSKQTCKQDHPSILIRHIAANKRAIRLDLQSGNVGAFIDTQTLGRALLGTGSSSLDSMSKRFKLPQGKMQAPTHGEHLTTQYIDYAVTDAQVTLNLLRAEVKLYSKHGLNAHPAMILSEASIGKNYFGKMGVPPFNEHHSSIPDWYDQAAIESFYGARSEVKIRTQKTEILYTDFKSQYPTVNALLDLQSDLISERLTPERCTEETQEFLNQITIDDLQRPETWKRLKVLVKIKADKDILPIKWKEGSENIYGVEDVTSRFPCWYTLADAVASKLLTGKAPKIINSFRLVPSGQIQTQTLNIFGDEKYSIDLTKQDFFAEVINLRSEVKRQKKIADKEGNELESEYLDQLQLALKLLANSSAYGILIETREEHRQDVAGSFYIGSLGVHITGAARLLLAIAETLGKMNGLHYAMCDTDSMAFAKPDQITREDFHKRVRSICDWFTPLNPYRDQAPILETEEINLWNEKIEPLFFLGISAKRYVIYNLSDEGKPRIRKMSAHGTGSYDFERKLDLPSDVDEPLKGVEQGKRWLYLLWYRAIEQIEKGQRLHIPNEDWTQIICKRQKVITKPSMLQDFAFIPDLKPFNFFTELSHRDKNQIGYVTPMADHQDKIINGLVFKKKTFNEIGQPKIKTLREAFATFFTHKEKKAANGTESGLMQRHSITVESVQSKTRRGKNVTPNFSLFNEE
jgi:hypothetical protein